MEIKWLGNIERQNADDGGERGGGESRKSKEDIDLRKIFNTSRTER